MDGRSLGKCLPGRTTSRWEIIIKEFIRVPVILHLIRVLLDFFSFPGSIF